MSGFCDSEIIFQCENSWIFFYYYYFTEIDKHMSAMTNFNFLGVLLLYDERGAVVEWLGTLGYGAESRWKIVKSCLGFAMPSDDWKILIVNPAVIGNLFSN